MIHNKLILKLDGHTLEISNPGKELIHNRGYTKSDFIDYYQATHRLLLLYAAGRPTSVLRIPEGYPGTAFFQRNRPKWAPPWIASKELGVQKKADYILLNDLSTLVWLLNYESIEFHCAQVTSPHFLQPNIMVFDLDPPLGCSFSELVQFAYAIKPVIKSYGYKPFVKTSGKSGIHIYCPLKPKSSFDEVFAASYEIGLDLVNRFKESTLQISKEKRHHKILIDIYRNHSFQSMCIPYGIRASHEANVSMPLSWKNLKQITSPDRFNLKTVPD